MAPGQKVVQRSENIPRAAPTWYIKSSTIKEIFEKLPVRNIFLCSCANCLRYADLRSGDNRKDRFEENELVNKYAHIYALLIYLRYAGLISVFRQHGVSLGENFLTAENLRFLKEHSKLTLNQIEIIRGEILQEQYRFWVRTFVARKEITIIDEKETLAIKEDSTPIGKGDFGEVYALDIPGEYMDDGLKNTVKKLKVSFTVPSAAEREASLTDLT